jgi:hypothetical protein
MPSWVLQTDLPLGRITSCGVILTVSSETDTQAAYYYGWQTPVCSLATGLLNCGDSGYSDRGIGVFNISSIHVIVAVGGRCRSGRSEEDLTSSGGTCFRLQVGGQFGGRNWGHGSTQHVAQINPSKLVGMEDSMFGCFKLQPIGEHFSNILLRVFKTTIGQNNLGVSYNGLPGFGITTVVEALNSAGQWPD